MPRAAVAESDWSLDVPHLAAFRWMKLETYGCSCRVALWLVRSKVRYIPPPSAGLSTNFGVIGTKKGVGGVAKKGMVNVLVGSTLNEIVIYQ